MDFKVIKEAVAKQFEKLQKHNMYRVELDKDALYATYLSSFPEGTNPMFRQRTEHDCGCCKGFISAVGNAVAIIDGKVVTLWDVVIKDEPAYQAVVDGMATFVKSHKVTDVFLHAEKTAGVDKNFEKLLEPAKKGSQTTIQWNHFFVNIDSKFVCNGPDIASTINGPRTTKEVFRRSLDGISIDSIDTVLELIAQNSIYRGQENKHAVDAFRKLKLEFDKLKTDEEKDVFTWLKSNGLTESVARIKNTAIGTLLADITEGYELEDAVKSFEAKVAPENYKRPTALATPKMIEAAKEQLKEKGALSATQRRYANIDDITVNNLLFVDRETRAAMTGDVFDDLVAEAGTKVKNLDKVEEISIEKFLSDIVPHAKSIEAYVENRHQARFVSLIAPMDPTSANLFKWDNRFSWSYAGGLADSSMRKAVQDRGGRVDGVFRFSHQWNHEKRNASLMDLHVFMPGNNADVKNSTHETYGNNERVGWNHRSHRASGGIQDVDYTDPAPVGYVPVENITFPDLERMPEGAYVCKIHNWQLRQPTLGGFKAEIEFGGQVFQYEYDKPLRHHEWVTVARVTLKNRKFEIEHMLPQTTSSKKVWDVQTQNFQKVNVLMYSPNYWDGQTEDVTNGTGNKHYFFMLDKCLNDGTARPFSNEHLSAEWNPHRKVFEMVGTKLQLEAADRQLSGLGFSSTQKDELVVRVKGSFERLLKIVFN